MGSLAHDETSGNFVTEFCILVSNGDFETERMEPYTATSVEVLEVKDPLRTIIVGWISRA